MEEITEESTLQSENISKKIPFWQNPKIPIVLALTVLGLTILVSGLRIWESQKEETALCSDCKEKFSSWCENCSLLNWPGGKRNSPIFSDNVCMKKCFGIDFPKTTYCDYTQKVCEEFGFKSAEDQVTITTDKTEYEQGEKIKAVLIWKGTIYTMYGSSIQRWKEGVWVDIQTKSDPYFFCANMPECKEVNFEVIEECPQLILCEQPIWGQLRQADVTIWDQNYLVEKKMFRCNFIQRLPDGRITSQKQEERTCATFGQAPSGKYKIRFEYALSVDPADPQNREIEVKYAEAEFRIKEKSAGGGGGSAVPGGDCSHNSSKGKCEIISVYDENKVRFKFEPTEPLDLEGTWFENEEEIVSKKYNSPAAYLELECIKKIEKQKRSPLTKEDLRKCDIKEGNIFDCEIEIITKGTCTPVIFRFY